jgi:hypothetical protein
MRSAGNFHPEWGYLAPTPSFVRTLRIVLVATAIGATAGAGVVVSLLPHRASGAGADSSIAAHALVTSVPAANSSAAAIAPAPPAAAASQAQTAAVSAQPAFASPQQPARSGAIGAAGTNTVNTAASPQSAGAANAANGAAPAQDVAHVEEPAVAAADHEDTAAAPEAVPSKKAATKRRRISGYEAIRRWQSARGETKKPHHGEGRFEPLFRLFSSRTSSPYSAN